MLEVGQRTVQAPKQCTGALSLMLPYRDIFAFFIFFLYMYIFLAVLRQKAYILQKPTKRIIIKKEYFHWKF